MISLRIESARADFGFAILPVFILVSESSVESSVLIDCFVDANVSDHDVRVGTWYIITIPWKIVFFLI